MGRLTATLFAAYFFDRPTGSYYLIYFLKKEITKQFRAFWSENG